MTPEEDLSKPLPRENALAKFWRDHGIELKPFSGPVAMHFPSLDMLLYLEEDCSYTSRPISGSGISILYSNEEPDKVVGIEILGFKQVAAFKIAEKSQNGS